MKKNNEVRQEIEKILKNPPPIKLMLQELRFNNVYLKNVSGDVGLFEVVNNNLIERVWRSYKISTLAQENEEEVEKLGIDLGVVNEVLPNQNPVEGFVKTGTLNIEVFRQDHTNIN